MTKSDRTWDASASLWSLKAEARRRAAGVEPPRPRPLAGDLTCDVAIVGGGLTGVFTAYRLIERFPDKRVVILEARTLGSGASGRNGGLLLNGAGGGGDDLDETVRVDRVTREAQDDLEALVLREKLVVPLRRHGLLEVITDPRRAEATAKEIERLRAAGLPHRFLTGDELRARVRLEGAEAAVLDPGGGTLDALALVEAMRPVLEARGVEIHEGTEVLRIHEGTTIRLATPGGEVRASTLVLATNAYTPRLGYFTREIVPLHSHVVATEARSAEAWAEAGWHDALGFSDDRDRLAFGGMTPEGELVFGGGSNAAYGYTFGGATAYRGDARRPFEAVEKVLAAYLPEARAKIAQRWTGPLALTWRRVCAMGRRDNVLHALGYSGHGLTLATLSGRVLTDLYAGEGARWEGLPFLAPPSAVPREPLRWIGYQLYTRLTGRSPRPKK